MVGSSNKKGVITMALQIYMQGNFVPDKGDNGRTYPIPSREELEGFSEIMYDKHIQPVSYIHANLVAVFNEWFQSFFPPNYFRFVRIKTQSSFKEFKSFMKQIYKKDKPFLVIDPRPVEIVEDTLFTNNMLGRYNLVDPDHDNIGAKMIYSLPIMISDRMELWYRRCQYKVEFDIMIMEETMNRQTDTYNAMLMNIRHQSKFMLPRTLPLAIPNRHIKNIANFHNMKWDSEEFLRFMNTISKYPIIRRTMPNGQWRYYMEQNINIRVEVPGYPSRDNPEMSEAIEYGARITDAFQFSAILPSEFLFLTKKEYVGKFDRGIEEDPDAISIISPVYADPEYPKEIGGYTLTNQLDIELQEGDDPKLQILYVISDYDKDIHSYIMEWVHRGMKLDELVRVKVYMNGKFKEHGAILHDDGTLEIVAPTFNKLYTANVYVNLQKVNAGRIGANQEFIGTIEKY